MFDIMIPTQTGKTLYSGHLKKDNKLYVSDTSLVVINNKKGNVFELTLGAIRCAYPTGHDTVKIFWRAEKAMNERFVGWYMYNKEFKLDLKKSFPDKTERKQAEKTQAKKLANVLLHAIQKNHKNNEPNMKGYVAMHDDEYVLGVDSIDYYDLDGGKVIITNMGIYFVGERKGLILDLPMDFLESYDVETKSIIKLHYYEPTWQPGYDRIYKNNCNIEIALSEKNADAVYETINKSFTNSGTQIIRTLKDFKDKFGSIPHDQLYKEFCKGKEGDHNEYDVYLHLLAEKKWGQPSTPAVQELDRDVIRACQYTGISTDVVGDLSDFEKSERIVVKEYVKNYEECMKRYTPLLEDINKIITQNLNDDDTKTISEFQKLNITHDVLIELVTKGEVLETFEPESLLRWRSWSNNVNKAICYAGSPNFPNGVFFKWHYEAHCFWTVDDAKRILEDKDYIAIRETMERLRKEFSTTVVELEPFTFAAMFHRKSQHEMLGKSNLIYKEWCKTHPLNENIDHNDNSWVEYIIENLDEERGEIEATFKNREMTAIETLRDLVRRSDIIKNTLERTVKPKNIPDDDIYVDAWHDKAKHRWFTTNEYFKINEAELHVITPEACEQKYGYKAFVYSEDAVQMKHGYPAIYDEKNKEWILLSTINEEVLTYDMVFDKRNNNTLTYELIEPHISFGNSGVMNCWTERENFLGTQHNTNGTLFPLNERIRRFLFIHQAHMSAGVTKEDIETQPTAMPIERKREDLRIADWQKKEKEARIELADKISKLEKEQKNEIMS